MKYYIVDLETTGLRGSPTDVVVDIGICSYDTDLDIVKDEYSSHVGYDTSEWTHRQNAWIFTHEGAELTVEDVDINHGCPPAEQVVREVREILQGQFVTSYNTAFDLDKFLLRGPWWINCRPAPDILKSARAYMHSRYDYDHSGCNLQKSYDWILCNTDPAHIGGLEKHLGLPDARMAAYVLRELIKRGMYRYHGRV